MVMPFLGMRTPMQAAEVRGSGWDKKWMTEYSMRLINWAKADFAKRSALVTQTTGEPAPLNYTHFHGELSKKDERFHNDFLQGTVSEVAGNRHIDAFLKDLERVRVELAAKEAQALPMWKVPSAEEPVMRSGTVYETSINSRNLGVILDNSPSMEPYLEKVRAEINREFSGSYMVEVNGCEMWSWGGACPWFYAEARNSINPFTPDRHCPSIPQIESKSDAAKRKGPPAQPPYQMFWDCQHDATSALLGMVQLMKVDAIYWFTDFDDYANEAAVKMVAAPLLEGKIKLYAHTMKKAPAPLLKLLIEKSGGELIKKPVR